MRARLSSLIARPALAALSAIAGLGLVIPVAMPATAAPATSPYVALGDSFSAGSGVTPADLSVNPLCFRSMRNYPKLVAAALGTPSFTDRTCGGAETSHFSSSQYLGVPAQLDSVTKDTRLVTLSIGGNDNGTFVGAITACGAAGTATLGFGSPCKNLYGDRFKRDVIDKTGPAVKAALEAIHAKAPAAHVIVLGYPWILPPTRGCYPVMPIAQGDLPYLRDLQATLNGVIEQAAVETRSTYVDFSVTSEGHDGCAPRDTRWVEPILLTDQLIPVHPNALGEAKMAEHVLAALSS